MAEKLIVDEDANATSSQQSIFKIGTKKIIVQGDIMDSGSDINSLQQNFFKILDKSVALPGDGDGTRTLSSAGSNDYFYLAKDQQPTHYTPESDIAIPIPPVPAWDDIIAHPTLSNNIVSYWKLDGNAADSVGSYNGIVSGATLTTGKINQAYNFDGADDYISIGDVYNTIFVTNTFSISIWFKINNYNDHNGYHGMLIQKWYTSSASNNAFILYCDGSWVTNTKSTLFTVPSLNIWHHIVVTMDNGLAKIYLDGILDATDTGHDCNSTTRPLRIGNLWNNHYDFDGIIDEVGIWSRVLTSQEITDLYNSGNGLKYG